MLPQACTLMPKAFNEPVPPPQVVPWLVYHNHLRI